MASQHGASKTAAGAETAATHATATAAKTAGKNTAAEIHRRPWSAELLLAVDAVPHVTPRRPAGHQQAKQRRQLESAGKKGTIGVVASPSETPPELLDFPIVFLLLINLRLQVLHFSQEPLFLLLQLPDSADDYVVIGIVRHFGLHVKVGQGIVFNFRDITQSSI